LNRDDFTSSYPICVIFFSFSCFISLARTSRTMLNRSGKCDQLCLVPDYRQNYLDSQPILRYISSIFSLLGVLIMRYIELCQILFLHQLKCSRGFSHMILSRSMHIYWCGYDESCLHPRKKLPLDSDV
jgi:hypothetical protein